MNRANHRPAAPVVNLELERTDTYFYLRAYWHILVKRRWTVLTVAIVLTTLVGIVSFRMQPVYEATARLAVEAETPEIQSFYDLYHITTTDDAFLQTQVNILQSDNLAWQTIEKTGLGEHADFASAAQHGEPGHALNVEQNRLIRAFRKHLRVELMRNSHMIEVTFESTDPQLAASVANALVGNYAEYSFHTKYDATRQASAWMEQQLDELKAKVEKSQQALVDYERQNAIVNVSDKQNVVEQRLADLSKDLTNAQSDRLQKQALDELAGVNESQVALLAQSELLEKLEEKAAELKTQYADAQEQYGPNFPKVVRLRDQVAEIQSLVEKERARVVGRIRHDYEAALAREKLLTAAVAEEKVEVGKLSQLLIQHNLLQREFETNQQLYDKLLQRLKDATVSAGLRARQYPRRGWGIGPQRPGAAEETPEPGDRSARRDDRRHHPRLCRGGPGQLHQECRGRGKVDWRPDFGDCALGEPEWVIVRVAEEWPSEADNTQRRGGLSRAQTAVVRSHRVLPCSAHRYPALPPRLDRHKPCS